MSIIPRILQPFGHIWHSPGRDPRNITMFDGASLHAVCKRCGEDIMKDSQGNWFLRGVK